MELEQILKRLRESGQSPSFAAPVGTTPPAPLKTLPTVTIQTGRRKTTVNDKGGGGHE